MSEKRVPPILYRYFSFGSFIEKVLSGESLRFQNPLAFNDPFDGRPSVYIDMDDQMTIDYWHSVGKKFHMGRAQRRRKIKEMKERVKKEGNRGVLTPDALRRNASLFGVLCLTPHPDNLLMWSHYGDGHKGVCVGFDTDIDFFRISMPVVYQDDYPEIRPGLKSNDQILQATILTKGRCWEYEHEWRVLKNTCSEQEKLERQREGERLGYCAAEIALMTNHNGPSDYPFDKAAVKEVILGASMPVEQVEQATAWVKRHNEGVKLARSQCHPHEYKLIIG